MFKLTHKIILGNSACDVSSNEYRQILLSAQYAILAVITLFIYGITEILSGKSETLVLYGTGILIIASTLYLHRKTFHSLSNYILFPTFNIIVYLIASSENFLTGAWIFFIPVALGSAAVFNYANRKIALAFALGSFLLCLLTLSGYSVIPFRYYTDAEMKMSLIINFIIAFPVTMMAAYLLIRMSHNNAEQLLNNNQQMHKLNGELDRFVYSTSHDLRAPLLSLMGLLKLAEKATECEMHQYHKMMYNRVENLDKFIRDITDYSRNNRLEVVNEEVSLKLLVNEIWESLQYSTDAQGIQFINDISTDQKIINDTTRLRVVLSNLISNAIRYHDHRKDKKYIRVSFEKDDHSVQVKITDNGQGIPTELQTKVFDMFFRGNETSQGSGLGLYIVKETLQKISASISLYSTPKEGSTFSICFPQK